MTSSPGLRASMRRTLEYFGLDRIAFAAERRRKAGDLEIEVAQLRREVEQLRRELSELSGRRPS